jgi:hypothetical protein
MLPLKGHLNTGLFHESQHNTPQLRSPLADNSSTPHNVDKLNGSGIYRCPGVKNCANFFVSGHLL